MPLSRPSRQAKKSGSTQRLSKTCGSSPHALQTDIAKDDVRVARSGHLPTLDHRRPALATAKIDGDGTQTQATSPISPISGGLENEMSTSIGMQVTVPIYSGGATQSQVRQRVYLHRAARERSSAQRARPSAKHAMPTWAC